MALLIIGVLLTAASWVAAWSNAGSLSEYSFFPLWLGYILTVNGAAEVVCRTSLVRVMRWRFLLLFVASIPLWWFFEAVNRAVDNWEYLLPHPISGLHYVTQASINFATVLPAVLSAAFLCYKLLQRHSAKPVVGPIWRVRPGHLALSAFVGLLSFLGLWLFPRETFPMVWIAPILILEPGAYAGGFPSFLQMFSDGRYLLPISVMSATLFTGLWWELWNYYSSPKWIYHIPYVGFWKIFEMPLLGYFGYPFFGLIIFSWASLVLATLFNRDLAAMFDDRQTR
jgi:hypothetical protein